MASSDALKASLTAVRNYQDSVRSQNNQPVVISEPAKASAPAAETPKPATATASAPAAASAATASAPEAAASAAKPAEKKASEPAKVKGAQA